MIVKICIGSSCHLKGSYDVVEGMKEMLRKYDVEELIELQASFHEDRGGPRRLRGRVRPVCE